MLATIGRLTRSYGVSLRTLRYYEQIGLIESVRAEGSAYRLYDERNCARLSQIILLRKLRIPLARIGELIERDDTAFAIEVFRENLMAVSTQADALSAIRSILEELIIRLKGARNAVLSDRLLNDDSLRALIRCAEPAITRQFKEVITVNELNNADKALNVLTDVRIIYLPPATVAASHFICDEPERAAGDQIAEFARSVNITEVKPDVRMYGFNSPNPVDESNAHGYEFWLTIPEDMDVPAPLVKKRFKGGLYAAHMIKMGDFHEWQWLDDWLKSSKEYEYNGSGSPDNMFDSLEEHLNVYTYLRSETPDNSYTQLDLLITVRKK